MELNYKEFGQGNPVVILHGLFGMLDNWQAIARHLGENFTVFILDQRNHGNSPNLAPHDYPSMADDLRHFMESHWLFSAHVVGHSMGGKTAMRFALDNPGMVKKLVVVDVAPTAYPERHKHIFDALFSLDLDDLADRKQADALLAGRVPDFGERQFLLKNLSRKPGGGYEFKMNLPLLHQHYDDISAAVESDSPFEKPALFIRGGESGYVGEKEEAAIRRLFPKSRIETVEGAGHWVHADKPEELLRLVEAFLKS